MRKTKFTALLGSAVIALSALTTPLMAGSVGIGFSANGMVAESSGTETLKTTSVKSSARGHNGAGVVASGYVQYMFGESGFVIGLEKIPGSLTLGDKLKTGKVDYVENTVSTAIPTVTNEAKAKIKNHFGGYIETPSLGGFFLKAGYSEVDVITQETLGTGAAYGDTTMNGTTIGFGFRGTADNGIHVKFITEATDYSSISLTSDSGNKIDGDIETWGAKISIGYNF